MPRLKKGVCLVIGGRTMKKEISENDLKLLKDHIKGKDKKLEDYLASEPKPEPKPEPVKEEKPPKSK